MADPGAGGHDIPAGSGVIRNPILTIPFLSGAVNVTNAQDTECGFFEKNYYSCMKAFGMHAGRLHCQLEARDFTECTTQDKTRARFDAIARERQRQVLMGERDRVYEDIDLFVPIHIRVDHYDNNRMHQQA